MNVLSFSLLITSAVMVAVLTLAFFDDKLKRVLSPALYRRLFIALALVSITGIVFTTSIGFAASHKDVNTEALVLNQH
jgi:hypothetical protein